ncbi:MAG TPA: carboxylating nicotinate-nucleotide diphosphorylase [Opitutaceae bacterium]|nr:carboxylating nicotinate-nucleotide diphosphorylase [Opitutaceae bacterium]
MLTPRTTRLIDLALEEDAARHDVTSRAIFPRRHRSRAIVDAKQDLVVCGGQIAARVFRRLDPRIRARPLLRDGAWAKKGVAVIRLEGPTASLLAAERTALNFLQRLSGIATQARRYADAVAGTNVRILDTRKTTPGWRELEKYAVRTGGCVNHRHSLRDLVFIKDNHIAAAGSLGRAVALCRAAVPRGTRIEAEAKTLAEVREAVAAGADIVLLDNMTPARVRRAARLVAGRALVEVSGGVRFETLRSYAVPGVDFISVGALTHSVKAADLSLDLRPAGRPS